MSKMILAYYLFIITIIIVALYHNTTSLGDNLFDYLGYILIPAFTRFGQLRSDVITKFLWFYLLTNLLLSVLQLSGIAFTVYDLFEPFGFFGTNELLDDWLGSDDQWRATGFYESNIAYSLILGLFIILIYYQRDYLNRSYLLLAGYVLLAIMTQTRAVIFSVIVVLGFDIVIRNRKLLQLALPIGLVLFMGVGSYSQYFSRFTNIQEDGSVIHRMQWNYYSLIGTLEKSPWLGIEQGHYSLSQDIFSIGAVKSDYILGPSISSEVTHHNQAITILRYYGLIGLAVWIGFFFITIRVYRWHKGSISLIFVYLLYSMSHNNMIYYDWYFWIIFVLNIRINENRLSLPTYS